MVCAAQTGRARADDGYSLAGWCAEWDDASFGAALEIHRKDFQFTTQHRLVMSC